MTQRYAHQLPGMDRDLPPFKFTVEAQTRIKRTLPSSAHQYVWQLERIVQQHLTDLPDDIVEREKKWTQIEEGARKLARLIKEVRVYRDSYEWIRLLLKDLAADALQQADQYALTVPPSRKKRDPRLLKRERLYRGLMLFSIRYVDPRLSYSHRESSPGHLVEFILAVMHEIPGEEPVPGVDAVIAAIRRNRSLVIF